MTAATIAPNVQLASQVAAAAAVAGLNVTAEESAVSFDGTPTARFTLGAAGRTTVLELAQSFDAGKAEFAAQFGAFLSETERRLHTPRPNALLTLGGLPLSYDQFQWPFHESTAGADTTLVHGQVNLETGEPSVLHAKIAASMTVTFREVVQAPEQPFAESFILNAVRKTLDQGQIELVKSGNRQPVAVTTRYYSARNKKFVFNDTDEQQRRNFLAAKVYWLSGVLGEHAPVWLLDPRDAQYLNSSLAELKVSVDALLKENLITLSSDPSFASPAPALMERKEAYEAEVASTLKFIKPSFNEDMRGGLTNM